MKLYMGKILRNIFYELCQPYDDEKKLQIENKHFANSMTMFLLAGMIVYIITAQTILELSAFKIFVDSSHLFALAFGFYFFSRIIQNEKAKLYIFSLLLFVATLYIASSFFQLCGPAVWFVVVIFAILQLIYSSKIMIINYSISAIVTHLFNWYRFQTFSNWQDYYTSQLIIMGLLVIAFGLVYKITETRTNIVIKQHNELMFSEQQMRSTLLSIGDGVITVDKDNRINIMNAIAEELTGWKSSEAKGRNIEEVFVIINEYSREAVEMPTKLALQKNEIVLLANHTLLVSKDGQEYVIEDSAAPIRNDKGEILGCVLVFRDSSERKQKQKEIEYLSYHDQLTGLYNRRFFEESLIKYDCADYLPISFIYADLNGLKVINDAFGHENGDRAIKEVAKVFKENCREDDIIVRIGGDEFVIALPKTSEEKTKQIVERINEKVNGINIFNIDISVSLGWKTKVEPSQDYKEILKIAEDFMYEKKILSKESKRNGILKSITNTLYIKSPREQAHSDRVALLCKEIGKAYEKSDEELVLLEAVGKLHDIGKIVLDANILNKEEYLLDSEWNEVQRHPEVGYRILSATNEFSKVSEAVLSHHERYDGKGYPQGLKGEEINWHARVVTIADAYDAMTSKRAYKKAMSSKEVLAELKKNAGVQFDPSITRVFVEKVLQERW